MTMSELIFRPITPENEAYVARIFAGDQAKSWVHYNTYWLENSQRLPDIESRLIYIAGNANPVGFIAYGQHYEDEELTRSVPQTLEIIHMVIDEPYQRQGWGKKTTLKAIRELRKWPGNNRIVTAHNPANKPAAHLYKSLGFNEYGRNYDGDPLMQLEGDEV